MVSFFSIYHNVGYRLVIYWFYYVEVHYFYSKCHQSFYHEGCWILSKAFSESIEMIMWSLSLLLLVCCITYNGLHTLNHSCIPEMKLSWSWCMIFMTCCWSQFAIILLRIFASMIIKEIDLLFSFFVMSCSGFGMSVTQAS
jgi:hypothetical protein